MHRAIVVQDYVAATDGDLQLAVGEIVHLLRAKPQKAWWKGSIMQDDAGFGRAERVGIFPASYVRELADHIE